MDPGTRCSFGGGRAIHRPIGTASKTPIAPATAIAFHCRARFFSTEVVDRDTFAPVTNPGGLCALDADTGPDSSDALPAGADSGNPMAAANASAISVAVAKRWSGTIWRAR